MFIETLLQQLNNAFLEASSSSMHRHPVDAVTVALLRGELVYQVNSRELQQHLSSAFIQKANVMDVPEEDGEAFVNLSFIHAHRLLLDLHDAVCFGANYLEITDATALWHSYWSELCPSRVARCYWGGSPPASWFPRISLKIETILWSAGCDVLTRNAQRQRRSVWALIRHLWNAAPAKVGSFVCAGFMTMVATKVVVVRIQVRHRVEDAVKMFLTNDCLDRPPFRTICMLVLMELACSATLHIVNGVTGDCIALTSAYNRERIKWALYRVLSKAPVSFFDVHSVDDIEAMVFYINDLEGVDVHLQTFLWSVTRSIVGLVACVYALKMIHSGDPQKESSVRGPLVSALRIVASMRLMETFTCWLSGYVSKLNIFCTTDEIVDAEQYENGGTINESLDCIHCPAPLLRGLDIFQNVHVLRPLRSADDTMMLSWIAHVTFTVSRNGQTFVERLVKLIDRRIRSFSTVLLSSLGPLLRHLLPVVLSAQINSSPLSAGGVLSVAKLLELVAAVGTVEEAITDVPRIVDLVLHNAFKAQVLQDLLQLPPSPPLTTKCLQDSNMIELRSVSFSYPQRPDRPVLHCLSLDIPLRPGTLVVLTGPSGAGKSTLLSLIAGLYPPSSGSISLCTTDSDWHDFSMVPQKITVFEGTVAENVSLEPVHFENRLLISRVQDALRTAACLPFVDALPEGCLTRIAADSAESGGASGKRRNNKVSLSGGQTQRLGIARALFCDTKYVLLDEPTASLDVDTKEMVIQSLKRHVQTRGKVALCVSHDAHIVAAADVLVTWPC